jgi:predicted alpha/beta superfamily hydrolase
MKRIQSLAFIFMAFLASPAFAQITLVIDKLPANTPPQDTIFIAGDLTGWNARTPEYMLHKNDQGKWTITLVAKPGMTSIACKFTRGSWASVEKGILAEEIPNRVFTFGNGTTIHIIISNWADNGAGISGGSTAAANVRVIDTGFFMPQLNRFRRIWLYFPPGYETSGLKYPVLYMQDGQNLFDALTSFSGEWEVDETLNKLASRGYMVPLVVGIDNGGADRMGEYTPWANLQYGGGDGEKYMQFIVETLKPYIDQHYRTLPDRNNTAIMGSSLGALITHYGGLKYQDVFSKAGLFSPSYWFADRIWIFTHQTGKQNEMRFYQLCGSNESVGEVGDVQRMNDSLASAGFPRSAVFSKEVPGGQHNEKLWREAFGEAYLWLFNAYATPAAGSTLQKEKFIRK